MIEHYLTLGLVAPTTFGKSTLVASLMANPKTLFALSAGDKGRTKITTEYRFDSSVHENSMFLEDISVSTSNIKNVFSYLKENPEDKDGEKIKAKLKQLLNLNDDFLEEFNKKINDIENIEDIIEEYKIRIKEAICGEYCLEKKRRF